MSTDEESGPEKGPRDLLAVTQLGSCRAGRVSNSRLLTLLGHCFFGYTTPSLFTLQFYQTAYPRSSAACHAEGPERGAERDSSAGLLTREDEKY